MEQVMIRMKEVPSDIGILFFDKNGVRPDQYWNDYETAKLLNYFREKIAGKKDVDLFIEGKIPLLLATKITVFAKDNGLKGLAFCLPGHFENRVYGGRT